MLVRQNVARLTKKLARERRTQKLLLKPKSFVKALHKKLLYILAPELPYLTLLVLT